ncbi:GNAT family N-acetyltransferase [Nocardioides sp. GY 10113]|uniref:GNAT family N-acetyltransferase n=1 Tax=Nocardioides sp. GY 10113 TaxID=2569761 RepID=UPI0010A8A47F|nr:GNAT family protein [Nocardioides sp. GY 10113]TIC81297.1 GNAT family N-acetyltransferase [Nocardioides sp. GY 10113]
MGVVPSQPSTLRRPLTTERLLLRAATAGDAADTWRYRRLAEVGEWITAHPDDPDEYGAHFADPDRLAVTVVAELRDPDPDLAGRVVGDFLLRPEDAWAQAEVVDRARGTQAELGWVLDPSHAGRGYATEAVRELLRYCFEELGVRRVVAQCFLDNEPSWRLMERVGMRREAHTVRADLHRSGRWLDSLSYAVLADEWAAAR